MNLHGRTIYQGTAEGEALVTSMGISFFGGVDPDTGIVVEKGHQLEGQSISGKVLVFPTGQRIDRRVVHALSVEDERRRPGRHRQRAVRNDHGGGLHHRRDSVRGSNSDRADLKRVTSLASTAHKVQLKSKKRA